MRCYILPIFFAVVCLQFYHAQDCGFLLPTENNDELECVDGSVCNGIQDGWDCCSTRGNRAKCPPNKPIMCDDPNGCSGSYCCEYDCTLRNNMLPRVCPGYCGSLEKRPCKKDFRCSWNRQNKGSCDDLGLACTNVNRINDRMGYYTCDCVLPSDQCLSDGGCIEESLCPDNDGQRISTDVRVLETVVEAYKNIGSMSCAEEQLERTLTHTYMMNIFTGTTGCTTNVFGYPVEATCRDGTIVEDVFFDGECMNKMFQVPYKSGECGYLPDTLSFRSTWSTGCEEPTCSDNILNGDEDWIDCGGTNCDSCECCTLVSALCGSCNAGLSPLDFCSISPSIYGCAHYTVADVGSNECPLDYERIMDVNRCVDAIEYICSDTCDDKTKNEIEEPNFNPKGCYRGEGNMKVWFNGAAEQGIGRQNKELLCVASWLLWL